MVVHDDINNDDEDSNTQALALLLANTTNTIDTVVAKVNSQINLDIKDHQTVIVFSTIRCDHILQKATKDSFPSAPPAFSSPCST